MIDAPLLWTFVLLGLCTLLLGLPFWPAWSEWRKPQDQGSMQLDGSGGAAVVAPQLQLRDGAHFDAVHGQSILLGEGTPRHDARLPALKRWQPPQGARPWGPNGWHIPHDLHVPAGHLVPCSLVVRGRFTLDGPACVQGDVKTLGKLRIGSASQILGNLFSEGDIHLDKGCRIAGVVMAQDHLHISPDVVIGSTRQPVSVCADVIDVQGPALVHGSLQAHIAGQVHGASTEHASDDSHRPPQPSHS